MTNEEFERIWQENRNRVLANDDEYQRISKSYTNWGWADYLILILGFVMCENFTKSLGMNIILQYLLAIAGMILVWLGFRIIKGRLGGRNTLEEVEKRVKERYRNTLH